MALYDVSYNKLMINRHSHDCDESWQLQHNKYVRYDSMLH